MTPTGQTPNSIQQTPKRKRKADPNLEEALTDMITVNSQSREQIGHKLLDGPEDCFFDMCAMRVKKISPRIRSYLQLQIIQLIMNAEHLLPTEDVSNIWLPHIPVAIVPTSLVRIPQPEPPHQHQPQPPAQPYSEMHNYECTGKVISDALNISNMSNI